MSRPRPDPIHSYRHPPEHNRRAFLLSLGIHVALVVMLVAAMLWREKPVQPMQVEMWAELPEPVPTAEQALPEEKPAPEPETPEPQPKPEPEPEPEPDPVQLKAQREAEIALQREEERKRLAEERARAEAERQREIERRRQEDERQRALQRQREEQRVREEQLKRQEEERRREEQRREQERIAAEKKAAEEKAAAEKAAREKAAAEKAAAEKAARDKAAAEKAAAEKKAAEAKAAAEKKAAEEKRLAEERERKLREAFKDTASRAAGLAGGTAARSQAGGGSDAGWGAAIRSCVKPNVAYPAQRDASGNNPYVIYRVQLGPKGQQVGTPQLVRSSGVAAFDRAVLVGIQRCDPLPPHPSGRFPSTIDIRYYMFD